MMPLEMWAVTGQGWSFGLSHALSCVLLLASLSSNQVYNRDRNVSQEKEKEVTSQKDQASLRLVSGRVSLLLCSCLLFWRGVAC